MKASTRTTVAVAIPAVLAAAGLLLVVGRGNHRDAESAGTPVIVPPELGRVPTLFIVGDSTAHYGSGRGWGDQVGTCFDPNLVVVTNRAIPGRSSRSYQEEGSWDKVLGELRSGDFVIIQFGHNDASRLDKRPDRGTLPDIGKRTKKIKLPSGETRIVHTFGWYMTKYITDAKAKGANPIVLSLTLRNHWKAGKIERDPEEYGKWAAQVAKSQNVTFIDLNTIIADEYDELGEKKVKTFFPEDDVHTSPEGAKWNAVLAVSGLRALKDFPLSKCLSAKGMTLGAYVPARAR